MPLHLLKLAVGVGTVAEFETNIAARLAHRRASGQAVEQIHTTRMVPKRGDDLLAGGSLFWVIRGYVAARQLLCDIRPFTDADGISRCHLVLEPHVVPVEPRPCRPFQGWRYLAEDTRPADLGAWSSGADMPEQLRYALRELCLL